MYFKGIKRSINSIYQETKYVANQSSWEYRGQVRSHKESFAGSERHRVGLFLGITFRITRRNRQKEANIKRS